MKLVEDSRCYFDQNMVAPDLVPVAGGIASVFSARCPGKETPNEDAAAVIPFDNDSAVLVVADGLGGGAAGERASRLAIESLKAAVQQARGSGLMLRTAIINGLERANRAVLDLGVGAATTLAAVEVSDRTVRPYHVGDSTILLTGGRGKLKFQTVAHSPVGYGVEAGLLDETEALHHEERHVVSNVLGTAEMRIEIGPRLTLRMRDRLLLATDGLADNLEPGELCCGICRGSVEGAMRQLATLSTQRMTHPGNGKPSKPDDLTMVMYRTGNG